VVHIEPLRDASAIRCSERSFGCLSGSIPCRCALDSVMPRGETLQFDRADFGAILVTLACFCACSCVEFAFDALVGTVEEIDGRPQQVLEWVEAGFAQARDEGIEDVGDGGSDDTGVGIGLGSVSSGRTITVKLEFGEDVIGRDVACAARGLSRCARSSWWFPSLDWSRSSRLHGDERRRAVRTAPRSAAKRRSKSGGWRERLFLIRDVKPPWRATENSRRTPLRGGRCRRVASQEGRERGLSDDRRSWGSTARRQGRVLTHPLCWSGRSYLRTGPRLQGRAGFATPHVAR